jgi:hypothetical protein
MCGVNLPKVHFPLRDARAPGRVRCLPALTTNRTMRRPFSAIAASRKPAALKIEGDPMKR